MVIIPELKTVVILVPRTGSRSLRRALEAKYTGAMTIYRHMEADGVPPGYDRWPRIGVIRNPLERLWSLYKFCHTVQTDYSDWCAKQHANVRRFADFSDWLVNNEMPFTDPYSNGNSSDYFPLFSVRHMLPENKKSQWMYLRPDLGTQIYQFDQLHQIERRLDITLPRSHETEQSSPPSLSLEADTHMRRVFSWDMWATGEVS